MIPMSMRTVHRKRKAHAPLIPRGNNLQRREYAVHIAQARDVVVDAWRFKLESGVLPHIPLDFPAEPKVPRKLSTNYTLPISDVIIDIVDKSLVFGEGIIPYPFFGVLLMDKLTSAA
jgi:hypothetical protein